MCTLPKLMIRIKIFSFLSIRAFFFSINKIFSVTLLLLYLFSCYLSSPSLLLLNYHFNNSCPTSSFFVSWASASTTFLWLFGSIPFLIFLNLCGFKEFMYLIPTFPFFFFWTNVGPKFSLLVHNTKHFEKVVAILIFPWQNP